VSGLIVAAASYAFFELVGAAYYLLAGVLIGNIWEAWRRAGWITFPTLSPQFVSGNRRSG
jgi:hypothetical protein